MAAILVDIQSGDEVITPSYTFVRPPTRSCCAEASRSSWTSDQTRLNLDESKIEAAITPRTKAIVPVHYARVGCEMDRIMDRSPIVTTCW